MRKRRWIWGISCLCISLLLCLSVLVYMKAQNARAEAGDTIPQENYAREKGTEDNPFVILEIVPYEGYAELGYLIAGCEPVDIAKLCKNPEPAIGLGTVKSIGGSTYTDKMFADEENIPEDWILVNSPLSIGGYYEKVKAGMGPLKKKGAEAYENVGDGNGDIIWVTTNDVTRESMSDADLNTVGNRIYTNRTDSSYYTIDWGNAKTRYKYVNYDDFMRNTLNVKGKEEIENYHIVVKTIRAKDLNKKLGWIDRADLISISPKEHVTQTKELWAQDRAGSSMIVADPPVNFEVTNDLNWAAVMKIFEKVNLTQDFAPIVLDWAVYNLPPGPSKDCNYNQVDYNGKKINTKAPAKLVPAYNNNVYRLSIMLKVMDPKAFYNRFLRTENGSTALIDSSGKYTIQTGDAQTYWNNYTFVMSKLDGTGSVEQDWKDMWNSPAQFDITLGNSNVSVNDRVYSYNGNNPLNQKFNTIGGDLNLGLKWLENYKKYLEDTGKPNTPATVLMYILGIGGSGSTQKETIRILDVEPSNDFKLDPVWFRNYYIPTFLGDIEIVEQNSQEFNGKIEDLRTEYDLIYFGLNVGGFKLTGGAPDYADAALDKKIYLSTGDKMPGEDWAANSNVSNKIRRVNWIKGHSGTTAADREIRLPGNDITKLRSQYLTEYLEAGYPILAEPDLYKSKLTMVDQNSNICKFFYGNTSNEKVINAGDTIAEKNKAVSLVNKYIFTMKPRIVFDSEDDKPGEYIGNETDGSIASGNYLKENKLLFKFRIEDGTNSKAKEYGAKLYADANADGKFADTVGDSEVIRELPGGLWADGRQNTMEKLVNDKLGALPWKLEIYEKNNPSVRYSVTGFSAIKRSNSEKQKIRVLQVNQDDGTYPSTFNLEKDISTGGKFKVYTENLNDYRFSVKTITITDFEKMYAINKFDKSTALTQINTDQLVKNYDMLIFGFADYYSDVSNVKGALDNVLYFIDYGKSVLFTHDVTSYDNISADGNNASSSTRNLKGSSFNTLFRGILSMDRFGIRRGENPSSYGEVSSDTMLKPTGTGTYWAQHGYTLCGAIRQVVKNTEMPYVNPVGGGVFKTRESNSLTTKAKKLNGGQITQYPYYIDDNLTVAKTHGQYYQLHMEDPGVVVWYTLAYDPGSPTSNVYEIMPGDASSNYYIYNKGNITYSGVGHSKLDGDMEVKLFVNTMVAAYKAALQPPAIEIVTPGVMKANDYGYYYFLNVDKSTSKVVGREIQEIDFKVTDVNLISQNMGGSVTLVSDSDVKYDIFDSAGNQVTSTVTGKDGVSVFTKLIAGDVYTIRYRTEDFNNISKRQLRIYVENEKGIANYMDVTFRERLLFDLD